MAALLAAAYAEFARELGLDAWARYRAEIVAAVRNPVGGVAVATLGRAIVGTVTFIPPGAPREPWFVSDCAVMRLLAVDAAARRGGVGRLLALWCVQRARASGAATLALATAPFMRSALALYRAIGFRPARTVAGGFGVELTVLELDLQR